MDVRAVITESFEHIHRSNLISMGVLPLQFPEGRIDTPGEADYYGNGGIMQYVLRG
jgi:aconitate hydratase